VSRIVQHGSRALRPLGWVQLFLFSLNLAWIAVWYELYRKLGFFLGFWLDADWPVRYLGWRVPLWMPESPWVLHQVVLSFIFCIPVLLGFLFLARLSAANVLLRAFAGAFAIAAYPLFALSFPEFFACRSGIKGNETLLSIETVLVLVWGVLYYLRKCSLSWAVAVPLLLSHFSLWAWKAGDYTSILRIIDAYPHGFIHNPHYWSGWLVILEGFGISVSMLFYYGFPVIGFLSALSSGWYLKLASDRALTA